MAALVDQQEVMGALADGLIEVFAIESCILRAEKLIANRGEAAAEQAIAMTQLQTARSILTIEASVRKVIAAVAEGDMLRTQMAIVRRLSKHDPVDTVALGRKVAARVVEAGKYTL
jgi:butyryl-CoA dehydrogenase